jgi:signal transduction histidine kinase
MKNSFNRPTVTVNQLQLLVEQEKIALAREIHDELGGHLIATAMDLAASNSDLSIRIRMPLRKLIGRRAV